MHWRALDQIDRIILIVLVHEQRDSGEKINGAPLILAFGPFPFEL